MALDVAKLDSILHWLYTEASCGAATAQRKTATTTHVCGLSPELLRQLLTVALSSI